MLDGGAVEEAPERPAPEDGLAANPVQALDRHPGSDLDPKRTQIQTRKVLIPSNNTPTLEGD